ncbi:hypothetical protein TOT_010000821 [Theileria orientalis strain Shintoku]|uniref:Uncharacterized protein n=1 Tax=Theileria orientalis strain Shintoku TaxID=869250 RepID=J4DNQ4_THEOR|nr:hypothetical protein TOT_010000821 [Theileria orientalis strain Shintoku]PVC54832.1 hypothetical protein MACL_00003559 [Theileria orientalis]BAM39364.1 hypothetical protein TOT_010000821 [Theileria orientalis strain Shintoku]|eukprot:XP_009689665.1 hypothetical protein TOT_010000821 [Theileria orientalis strain Shintoku]
MKLLWVKAQVNNLNDKNIRVTVEILNDDYFIVKQVKKAVDIAVSRKVIYIY